MMNDLSQDSKKKKKQITRTRKCTFNMVYGCYENKNLTI